MSTRPPATSSCPWPTRASRSPPPSGDSRGPGSRPKAGSMQLHEYASIIRSKNAGPFCLTIDVFFADAGGYALARRSDLLTVPGVARAYGVAESDVKGVWWDERVLGAKVSLLGW